MLEPLPFVSCSFNYLLFIKVVTLNNLIDTFTASRSSKLSESTGNSRRPLYNETSLRATAYAKMTQGGSLPKVARIRNTT
jgi:hypothetical protein